MISLFDNAVYFAKPKIVIWKDVPYEFRSGKNRDFGVEFCVMLVEDLITLDFEIMKDVGKLIQK